jgi:hypothetical protein
MEQAWLLNEAAFKLGSLGRITEAVEPVRVAGEMYVADSFWKGAAISYRTLSYLEAMSGRLVKAVADSRRAVKFADQSGDELQMMIGRSAAANALHQAGKRAEAETLLEKANRLQANRQPDLPLLSSVHGFLYADLLMASAERASWQVVLRLSECQLESTKAPMDGLDALVTVCAEAERRATQTRLWGKQHNLLLDDGLDSLTLARAQLAEAQQIAERGPMPLYLADVHLHRARLFRDRAELAQAAKLIRDLGYGRRFDELADAETALARE